MNQPDSPIVFDKRHASEYDQQRSKLAAMRETLHLFIQLVLQDLPNDAHMLCVGAGTGAELIDLAKAFPNWKFTVVEPAEPMLDQCRQRATELGFFERCTFHHGYLDSLSNDESFHGATSILVSHFLLEKEKRQSFFEDISSRLKPNGYLINCDIASDMASDKFKSLFEVWINMLRYSDLPEAEVTKFKNSCGRDVAVLPIDDVEAIMVLAGFNKPVLFFQSLLIHAWYTQVKS